MTRTLMGRGSLLVWPSTFLSIYLTSGCALLSDLLDEESEPDARYAGICVDQATEQRLPDEACGDFDDEGHSSSSTSYFLWLPMDNSPQAIPPVGSRAYEYIGRDKAAGLRGVPKGTPIAKGIDPKGGTVSEIQRGGFGLKSGTSGGSGAKAAGGGKSGGS